MAMRDAGEGCVVVSAISGCRTTTLAVGMTSSMRFPISITIAIKRTVLRYTQEMDGRTDGRIPASLNAPIPYDGV